MSAFMIYKIDENSVYEHCIHGMFLSHVFLKYCTHFATAPSQHNQYQITDYEIRNNLYTTWLSSGGVGLYSGQTSLPPSISLN